MVKSVYLECRGADIGKSSSVCTGRLTTRHIDHIAYSVDLGVGRTSYAVVAVSDDFASDKLVNVGGVVAWG